VVRDDLPHGLQASQAIHAAHQYSIEHREEFERWFRDSNTIVLVSVPNADALDAMRARAASVAVPASAFSDDDVGPRLTSLAIGPGAGAKKLCQALPLAMRERKEVRAA